LQEQQKATAAALFAKEENWKLAEKRSEEKLAALDQMLKSFSDDRLKVMPGAQEVRQVFLEKGLHEYEQILRDRQDDRTVKSRLADSYRELGMLRRDVGATAEAMPALQKAVEFRRELVAAAPDDPAAAAALGHALFQLGQYYWEQKRPTDATPPVQESVDIFTRLLEMSPTDPAYKAALGRGLTRLASVKPEVGEEKALRRALSLLREAVQALPDNAEMLTDLGRTLNNLAARYPAERQLKEGVPLYDECRQVTDKALALNPAHALAHTIRMVAINDRVSHLAKAGRVDESIRALQEAIRDSKAFVRKNPAVVSGLQDQVELQDKLARLYWESSKQDQAIKVWEEIARVYEGLC
jgi:tetratricopeptide (TPR) repeat protein